MLDQLQTHIATAVQTALTTFQDECGIIVQRGCKHPKEKMKILGFSDDLVGLLQDAGAWIAGGALTSVFTGKPINDFDIYFPSADAFSDTMERIFSGDIDFGAANVQHATNKSVLMLSDEAKVQFIVFKYFSSVEEIFKSFDFTAVMAAYSFEKDEFYFHEDFMQHNAQRFLKFNSGTDYPLISMLRVDKYRERGYTTSKQVMLQIGLTINKKEYSSWEDVKEEIGSMYGISPNKLFDETKEFSIQEVIDQLDNVILSQTYTPETSVYGMTDLVKKMPHKMSDKIKEKYPQKPDLSAVTILPLNFPPKGTL